MRTLILVTLSLGFGCGGPQLPQQQTATFSVTFTAESDPGMPLAGVVVKANGREVGSSDEYGVVQTMLRGPEGAGVQISHECPEGYVQPTEAQTLRLHTFQSLDRQTPTTGLNSRLVCTPAQRRVAFVVRSNRPNLPVKIDGEEVARTNESGYAYVVRTSPSRASYRVSIDPSSDPTLRPQNPPPQQFQIDGHDDVFVLSQNFETERPQPTRRRRRRRRSTGPIRIIRIN